jgi:hypothetical protein
MRVRAIRYHGSSCSIVERHCNSDGLMDSGSRVTHCSEDQQHSDDGAEVSIESGYKPIMGTSEACVAEPQVPANTRHNTDREALVPTSLMNENGLESSVSEFLTAQTAQSRSTFYTAELPSRDANFPTAASALPFR